MTTLVDQALATQLKYLLPEIILVTAVCVLFLGGTWKSSRNLWSAAALFGLALAGLALIVGPHSLPGNTIEARHAAIFGTPLVFDSLTTLMRVLALGSSAIFVLLAWNEVPEEKSADFLACLLAITAGASLTAASNDLVAIFLALELVSIPTYILLYLPREGDEAQEAALKYFLLSIFSSALVLFGFSYLYGLVGSTNLAVIQHTLDSQPGPRDLPAVALVTLITIVAGLGFRITAVPFHFYAPDVYQGTATTAAGLLAFVPKLVGFVALVRVLGFVLPPGVEEMITTFSAGRSLSQHVPILLWFLAAVSMTVGNLGALPQENIRRLLAYSSVAHAGYMLVALAAAPYLHAKSGQGGAFGLEALWFYLAAYGAMTVGAFAVLAYLGRGAHGVENIDDLAGLGRSHPVTALMMMLFLFSLVGIPLTAGFLGKFLIFFGAMAVPDDQAFLFRVLAVIGMLNAAIASWYYLRIVAVMYLRNALHPIDNPRSLPGVVTMVLCAILTVALTLPPASDWLLDAAHRAAGTKEATVAVQTDQ